MQTAAQSMKELREYRKERGLCLTGGCARDDGKLNCSKCRAKENKRSRDRNRAKNRTKHKEIKIIEEFEEFEDGIVVRLYTKGCFETEKFLEKCVFYLANECGLTEEVSKSHVCRSSVTIGYGATVAIFDGPQGELIGHKLKCLEEGKQTKNSFPVMCIELGV